MTTRRSEIGTHWRLIARAAGVAYVVGMLLFIWVRGYLAAPRELADGYVFVAPICYLVPGAVLLLRRNWHVVGWLLCLFAVGLASAFVSDWGTVRFGGPWMMWLQDQYEGAVFWLPLIALLVVFPDGLDAQPPGQRRFGRVVLSASAAATVATLCATQMLGPDGTLVASPLPIAFVPHAVQGVTIAVIFGALVAAFAGLVARDRSSQAVARRQYRWVLSAVVVLVAGVLVGVVGSLITGRDDGPWWAPVQLGYLAVPLAFMVAILRYRLYDIDRVVTRTVSYSLVVIALGCLYVVVVGLLTQVLPLTDEVAVAASTLAVAAAFTPLRRRVQRGVDRRFNRPRFDAAREVEGFTRGLRNQTDLTVVEAELRGVVDRTLRPATVDLWLRRDGG